MVTDSTVNVYAVLLLSSIKRKTISALPIAASS